MIRHAIWAAVAVYAIRKAGHVAAVLALARVPGAQMGEDGIIEIEDDEPTDGRATWQVRDPAIDWAEDDDDEDEPPWCGYRMGRDA